MASGYDYTPGAARKAYEQEHAGLSGQAGAYGSMLRAARGINTALSVAQLPVLLGVHAFLDDEERRRNIMRTMNISQVATGVPLVYEASRAGAKAVRESNDPRQAIRELAMPTWPLYQTPGGEYLRQSWPLLRTLATELYF